VIESCKVLEEKADGTVIRDVKFKEGKGPKPQARETVREHYPSWVSAFAILHHDLRQTTIRHNHLQQRIDMETRSRSRPYTKP